MRRLLLAALSALGAACLLFGAAAAAGNPSGVLISDATGKLHFFDSKSGALSERTAFADGGNFDIKYASPSELVLANLLHGRIDSLDLRTGQVTNVVPDETFQAIGIAVSPRGVYYVTDHSGSIYSYETGSGTVALLADRGPDGEAFCSPDGIVLDRRGNVVFTDHCGRIYRITRASGAIELVATIAGSALNGVVLDRQGALVVAAHDAAGHDYGAVYRVDPDTGAVETLFEGLPLRDPEDVALDQHGDVFVLDSDFQSAFGDHSASLFVLRADSGSLETLAQGLPGDPVDILLTPFTGPGDR